MKIELSLSTGALSSALKAAGVPDDVVSAIETAIKGASNLKDPSARAYARSMGQAFDEYGVEGVKMQVLYLLGNLGKFQGDDAKQCKKVLKKWASK